KAGFAAFYEELGRVGLVDDYGPKGNKQVSISGRQLREKLRAGELPAPRSMRPERARVLLERVKEKKQAVGSILRGLGCRCQSAQGLGVDLADGRHHDAGGPAEHEDADGAFAWSEQAPITRQDHVAVAECRVTGQ